MPSWVSDYSSLMAAPYPASAPIVELAFANYVSAHDLIPFAQLFEIVAPLGVSQEKEGCLASALRHADGWYKCDRLRAAKSDHAQSIILARKIAQSTFDILKAFKTIEHEIGGDIAHRRIGLSREAGRQLSHHELMEELSALSTSATEAAREASPRSAYRPPMNTLNDIIRHVVAATEAATGEAVETGTSRNSVKFLHLAGVSGAVVTEFFRKLDPHIREAALHRAVVARRKAADQ